MRTSKVKKYWIIAASIWTVFWLSVGIRYYASISKNAREKVNVLSYNAMRKLLKLVSADIEIFGGSGVKFEAGHPYIVMSNHCSHYDIPLMFVTFPKQSIRMIAKKELLRVPVWGRAISSSECISIDRDNPRQAVKDLQSARKKIESGIVLWIAPEGTRSRNGKLGEFKKGGFKLALQTGATIIPVCIVGSEKILPPESTDFSVGEKVKVYITNPIDATQYKDITELMRDTESAIRKAGNIE